MTIARSAVKVPMKKLFAVASLVGAVTGTALVVRATTDERRVHDERGVHESCGIAPGPIAAESITPIVAPTSSDDPSMDPVIDTTIQPLVLPSGAPACGNVTHKGSTGRCADMDRAQPAQLRGRVFDATMRATGESRVPTRVPTGVKPELRERSELDALIEPLRPEPVRPKF